MYLSSGEKLVLRNILLAVDSVKSCDENAGRRHLLREAIIRKKILFYEKVLQTGRGGHLVFIPLFFFKDCVESPLCGAHKLDRLRDNF